MTDTTTPTARIGSDLRTIEIYIDNAQAFELPVNKYGGSGNGGKLGRAALDQWQKDNPGVARIPLELISGYTWRPVRVTVRIKDGEPPAGWAFAPSYPVESLSGGVPREDWPDWLTELVNATLTAHGVQL